jgi:hypothetical protein
MSKGEGVFEEVPMEPPMSPEELQHEHDTQGKIIRGLMAALGNPHMEFAARQRQEYETQAQQTTGENDD